MKDNAIYTYKGKKVTVKFKVDGYSKEWGDGRYIDYQDTVEIMHPDIKWVHGTGGSYQGEWWSAGYNADGEWFSKQGSFGSCSGCDWLESIDDADGMYGFIADMERIDPIGHSAEEAIAYLEKSKDNTYDDAVEAIDEVIKAIKEYCEEMECVKRAIDNMLAKIDSGEIKSHRYTLEEFENKYGPK